MLQASNRAVRCPTSHLAKPASSFTPLGFSFTACNVVPSRVSHSRKRLRGVNVYQDLSSRLSSPLSSSTTSEFLTFLEWYNAISTGTHDAVDIPHQHLNDYTSLITNFYNYGYDTELPSTEFDEVNFFTDDTHDMYDDGQYISFIFTRNSTTTTYEEVNYGSEVNNGTFGYLVTRPDTYNGYNDIDSTNNTSQISRGWPLVAVGWTKGVATIRIRVTGNLGSDGDGETDSYSPQAYTANKGRYGTIWTRNNYDTSDPTLADIWFTVLSSMWGSSVLTTDVDIDGDNSNMDSYVQITGQNVALFHVLLARKDSESGDTGAIPLAEITNFVSKFVGDMVFEYLSV